VKLPAYVASHLQALDFEVDASQIVGIAATVEADPGARCLTFQFPARRVTLRQLIRLGQRFQTEVVDVALDGVWIGGDAFTVTVEWGTVPNAL